MVEMLLQMNLVLNTSDRKPTSTPRQLEFYAKREQRSFSLAYVYTSFGVRLAYGMISVRNPPKEKSLKFLVSSRNFRLFCVQIDNLLVNRLHRREQNSAPFILFHAAL